MALNLSQQFLESIKRSHRPLICIAAGAGPDGYATALGLHRVLHKLEKHADIVAPGGALPANMQFLSGNETIAGSLKDVRQLVIELDASQTPVDELYYEIKDNRLFIYVSPQKGFWEPHEVKTSTSGYRYDLIITVDAPDLEALSHLYKNHPDFFYHTPIINIDHRAENEYFGQINLVDVTASSCGEVCHDLIEEIDPSLIDEQVATAFLTGLIAKTKSFKTANTTPKTLQTAGKLIAKGAKQETVVQHLYRTRTLPTLKLWGRTLARLKADRENKIVWSLLSSQDFLHAGAASTDLPDVIDELITSSPDAGIVALIYEDVDVTKAIVHAEKNYDALQLTTAFQPEGTKNRVYLIFPDKNIIQAEKELIEHLQKIQ